MDYWPIVGYGLKITYDYVSNYLNMMELAIAMISAPTHPNLISDLNKCTSNSEIYDILNDHDMYTGEIVEFLSEQSKFIYYNHTGDILNDEADHYLLYQYTAPWDTQPKVSTKEEVQDEIIKLLSPYLLDVVDTINVRNRCKEYREAGGSS